MLQAQARFLLRHDGYIQPQSGSPMHGNHKPRKDRVVQDRPHPARRNTRAQTLNSHRRPPQGTAAKVLWAIPASSSGMIGGSVLEAFFMMFDMANLTLVYGLRLLPEGEVTEIQDATLKLANGHQAHVTMHMIEGSREEIETQLKRSLDAFFDFYPEI